MAAQWFIPDVGFIDVDGDDEWFVPGGAFLIEDQAVATGTSFPPWKIPITHLLVR